MPFKFCFDVILYFSGMTAYAVPISSEASAAVLSGIVAGILFMTITLLLALRFCLRRVKGKIKFVDGLAMC